MIIKYAGDEFEGPDEKLFTCTPFSGNFLDKNSHITILYKSDYFKQLAKSGCDPYLFSSVTKGILFYIASNNLNMLKKHLQELSRSGARDSDFKESDLGSHLSPSPSPGKKNQSSYRSVEKSPNKF